MQKKHFARILLSVLFFSITSFYLFCNKSFFNTVQATRTVSGHFSDFTSIMPSQDDRIILPQGYHAEILISEGDRINPAGDTFGANNDNIQFFPEEIAPSDETKIGKSGYLFVSHEFVPVQPEPRNKKSVHFEKYSVGASILKIRRNADNEWTVDTNSTENRRYTAMSRIRMDGPASGILGNFVTGTADNCSGGRTPWGTALSGEESTNYGTIRKWDNYDERSSGWIVEFDPFNKNHIPVKHSAMGRFKHENAAVVISKNSHAVVYMGEDRAGGGFYKFISERKYIPGNRKHNMNLLASGRLFGARIDEKSGRGEWVPVDISHPGSSQVLFKEGFASQEEVLLDIARASKALKITPLDRPEDCEIHPLDGSVYLALTNNMGKVPPNLHGQIVHIAETGNNHEAASFDYGIFSEGGAESGFSSPDNLAFDSLGNLWVATDVFSSSTGKIPWDFNGNNSLLMIKTDGKNTRAFRFASSPSGSEFSGPWFAEDEKTLFLSVQHPGEGGKPSSWPDGKARSAVIAIYKD